MMKNWLKITLFLLLVLILGLVGLIVYIKSSKACPLGTESTFSVFGDSSGPVIRECDDCELTKLDYKLGLTSKSAGECKNVKKVCYVCLKKRCPGSYCATYEEIYVKVNNFVGYLLNIIS